MEANAYCPIDASLGGAVSSPVQFPERREGWPAEEQLFRTLVEHTPDYAFILLDQNNRVLRWNVGAERVFGYTESEIQGAEGSLFFTAEDRANGGVEQELISARRDGKAEDDRWHVRKDGSRFWSNGVMRPVRDAAGELKGYIKILRDLTAEKQSKERLQRSQEQLRLFIDNVTDYALIQVDLNGHVSSWNPGAQRITGYTEEEILGKDLCTLCTQEDTDAHFIEEELKRAIQKGVTEEVRWFVRKDGRRFWARWVTHTILNADGQPGGFAKVMRDETERKRAEERLRASLLEKDVLLQEIHHRVKNNLQVVVSLLSIQANRLQQRDIIDVLNDTQNRVRAIAGIHETLYASPDLANISFSDYMEQLIRSLFSFYNVDASKIDLQIKTDDIVIDITQAVPLGLVLNELMTNALKHAFPDGRSGTVSASLRYVPEGPRSGETLDEGSADLTIEDSGVGLPAGFDIQTQESMGMYLIRVLTRQLRGAVHVSREPRTQFRVVFPLRPLV
jgi:PAS domain S-box-containing protein